MKEKNNLILTMGLLYLFVILILGLILISEKKDAYIKPKIYKRLTNYINNKYKDEQKDFKYSKLIKDNQNNYYIKIYNKNNKNLYFKTIYNNKKIIDTYKKDYLEGNTLNKYIEKKLNKELNKRKNNIDTKYNNYNITYKTKFNNCTNYIKKKLLKNNYLIPIYTVNIEVTTDNIKQTIIDINNDLTKLNLIPKNYNITINNKKNITKSINLIIEPAIIESNIDEVVNLINNNDFTTLNKYNVKCKYLN